MELDKDCIFEKKKWISITGLCNNNCLFCLDGDRKDKNHKDIDKIKIEIKKGKEEGCKRLVISGGDPTVYPHLKEIIEYGNNIGYQKIQLVTNGRMFANEDFAKKIISAGVNELTFSIHGHNAKIHDNLTNVPGSFKQIIKGIKNISKNSNIIINSDTCITKKNYKLLLEIVKFISKTLKINEINLMNLLPIGNAWKYKENIMYEPKEVAPYIHKVIDYCRKNDITLWLSRFPPEYLKDYEEYIEDPIKRMDDVEACMEELKKEIPGCKGEKCNYCPLNKICENLTKLNSTNSTPYKEDEKEIIITKENLNRLSSKLISNRNKKVILKLVEPTKRLCDYKKIVPQIKDIIPYLKTNDYNNMILEGIPQCILEKEGIINLTVREKRIDYQKYEKGNEKDILNLAEELAITTKIKNIGCNKCKYQNKCKGIYLNYIRLYGFNDMNPIRDKKQDEIELSKKLNVFKKINKLFLENNLNILKGEGLVSSIIPIFNREQIMDHWKNRLAKLGQQKNKEVLSFYVHVPFCIKKCHYCLYDSIPYSKEKVKNYLKLINFECNFFKKIFKNHEFDTLYIGGGTPNILTEEELENMLLNIFNNFKFSKKSEIKIECNPLFNTKEKLRILKKYGFNVVSFGVQSFDNKVLTLENRDYQKTGKIEKAMKECKEEGINDINIDLMLGIEGDTTKKFLKSFDIALSLKPENLIIYKLLPTKSYRKKFLDKQGITDKNIFNEKYNLKKLFDGIKEIARKREYDYNESEINESTKNMGIGFRRKDTIPTYDFSRKNYSFAAKFPISCFGIGPFSQSHIYGALFYQYINNSLSLNRKEKLFTGNKITIYREIYKQMVDDISNKGYIDIKEINNIFNINFTKKFEKELTELNYLNAIIIKDNKLFIKNNKKISVAESFLYFIDKDYLKLVIREEYEKSHNPLYLKKDPWKNEKQNKKSDN